MKQRILRKAVSLTAAAAIGCSSLIGTGLPLPVFAAQSQDAVQTASTRPVPAVLDQYLEKKGIRLEGAEKLRYMRNLLMTSAVPYMENDMFVTPRRQGAGLVSLNNVVADKVLLTGKEGESKIQLRDKVGDSFDFELNLRPLLGFAGDWAKLQVLDESSANVVARMGDGSAILSGYSVAKLSGLLAEILPQIPEKELAAPDADLFSLLMQYANEGQLAQLTAEPETFYISPNADGMADVVGLNGLLLRYCWYNGLTIYDENGKQVVDGADFPMVLCYDDFTMPIRYIPMIGEPAGSGGVHAGDRRCLCGGQIRFPPQKAQQRRQLLKIMIQLKSDPPPEGHSFCVRASFLDNPAGIC